MTMLAHLLPCITRQRPVVDTIRDDGAAEREVVRCCGCPISYPTPSTARPARRIGRSIRIDP